jgi:hypothetical protein
VHRLLAREHARRQGHRHSYAAPSAPRVRALSQAYRMDQVRRRNPRKSRPGETSVGATPLAQRHALGMPEDIFRIDTSLDLHQSREIVAPISPCIAIAEIEIAIIHIGPTGNMRSHRRIQRPHHRDVGIGSCRVGPFHVILYRISCISPVHEGRRVRSNLVNCAALGIA